MLPCVDTNQISADEYLCSDVIADLPGSLESERFAEAFIVRGDLVVSDIGLVDFESSFVARSTFAPAHLPKTFYSVSCATISCLILV